MALQSAIGPYNLFAASYPLNVYQLAETNVKFDVSVSSGSSQVADSFKNTRDLPTTCATLSSNTSTTSSAYAYQGCYTDSPQRTLSGAVYYDNTIEKFATDCRKFL